MRAVIYARISQDPRDTGLGIQRQIEDCEKYCQEKGLTLVRTHVDNDISAYGSKRRPEYEEMLTSIEAGEVDIVVATKFDRLSRRLRSSIELCELLLKTNTRLHDLSGETDLSTATGITVFQLAAVMAENKVRIDQENNLRARRQVAEQGKRVFSSRPYGYEEDGYTLRSSEASIVREMCERIIGGETPTAIARDLNRRGVTTIKGSEWSGRSVRACARRASNAALRFHHGVVYQGVEQWQPIITREQWEQVCRILDRPTTKYKRGAGRKYPFYGLVVCGKCGNIMSVATGRVNGGEAGYRCDPKKSHEASSTSCGGVQRAQVPVDYLVRESLIARCEGGKLRDLVAKASTDTEAVTGVVQEITAARERLDALVDDYANGLLDRQQLARAKATAEDRLHALESQLSTMTVTNTMSRVDWSKSVREIFEGADVYWLRDVAALLIDRVEIMPQGRGWKVEWLEIGGRKWRFQTGLVKICWRV